MNPLNLLEDHFYKLIDMDKLSQERYLRELASTQADIVADLEALLSASGDASDAFEEPLVPIGLHPLRHLWRVIDQEEAVPPLKIGQFQVEEVLGTGGMGIVYKAKRESPTKEVALKVLRAERDDPFFVKRFQTEIQALAMMEHENIAHFYDTGTTEANEAYLVMEYIPGEPIHRYCEKRKLGLKDRIRLVQQVCDGVCYAHSRGILHGDLKPMNILVVERVEGPKAKIIDFGISQGLSKATKHINPDRSRIIGSPYYMSPQQADEKSVLDVRCDVYALGVILFELIAGNPPLHLDPNEHRENIIQVIKTSRRNQLGPINQERANSFNLSTKSLNHSIKQDLKWVTAKALAVDPDARYETVQAFREDLSRFLRLETVNARNSNLGYRFEKWRRRKKWLALTALTGTLAMIFIFSATLFALHRAEKSRKALEKLSLTHEFYDRLVKTPHPNLEGHNIKFVDVLAYWESALASQTNEEPEQTARMHMTLGETCFSLGLYGRAVNQFGKAMQLSRKSLGPSHPNTLHAMERLAFTEINQGEFQRAGLRFDTLIKEADTNSSVYYEALCGKLYLALQVRKMDEAEELFLTMSEAQARLMEDSEVRLDIQMALANYHRAIGDHTKAEKACREIYQNQKRLLGEQHPKTILTLQQIAQDLRERGKYREALPVYKEVYEKRYASLGEFHLYTLKTRHGIALCHMRLQEPEEAYDIAVENLDRSEMFLGKLHSHTLEVFNTVAALEGEVFGASKALDRYRLLVKRYRDSEQIQSENGLKSLNNLAHFEKLNGLLEDAMQTINLCLELKQQTMDPWGISVLNSKVTKAEVLERMGKVEDAAKIYGMVYKMARKYHSNEPQIVTRYGYYWAKFLIETGEIRGAVEILTECLNTLEEGSQLHQNIKGLIQAQEID